MHACKDAALIYVWQTPHLETPLHFSEPDPLLILGFQEKHQYIYLGHPLPPLLCDLSLSSNLSETNSIISTQVEMEDKHTVETTMTDDTAVLFKIIEIKHHVVLSGFIQI